MRRLTLMALGVIASLAILIPVQTVSAPPVAASARPSTCPGWNSTTRPPDYIRVLRRHSGKVDRVPFKKYVITVMGKEWPGYLPQALIQAGAVAVKQYAWFHALGHGRLSRHGQCYDVTDGVADQLYKPNKARIRQDHYIAVAATWGVRLTKNGSLFMTGYRTGNKGRCGHDSTGWKLFARSAARCANRGDGYLQILRIYYGPVAIVNGGGSGGGAAKGFSSLTIATAAPAPDASEPDTSASSSPGTAPLDASAPDESAPAPGVSPVSAMGGANGGVGILNVTVDEDLPIGERAFTAA